MGAFLPLFVAFANLLVEIAKLLARPVTKKPESVPTASTTKSAIERAKERSTTNKESEPEVKPTKTILD